MNYIMMDRSDFNMNIEVIVATEVKLGAKLPPHHVGVVVNNCYIDMHRSVCHSIV